MKYIDAEKLKAKIEWQIKERDRRMKMGTYISTSFIYEDLLNLIDSLQQEESTGVDLEKEINEKYRRDTSTLKTKEQYARIARHFYELGQRIQYQQDREEFAKLEAKEWESGYDEGYAKGLNATENGRL